jgi:hypothetical protein
MLLPLRTLTSNTPDELHDPFGLLLVDPGDLYGPSRSHPRAGGNLFACSFR